MCLSRAQARANLQRQKDLTVVDNAPATIIKITEKKPNKLKKQLNASNSNVVELGANRLTNRKEEPLCLEQD